MAVVICEKQIGSAALHRSKPKAGLPGTPVRRAALPWARTSLVEIHSVPPGRDHFPKPTPDSAVPCRSASGSGSIRGYYRGVPPALALSVRGKLAQ